MTAPEHCDGSPCDASATGHRSRIYHIPLLCTRTASCFGASACGRSWKARERDRRSKAKRHKINHSVSAWYPKIWFLQVILTLESLRAHPADVLALIAVCQFVLCQRRGIAKHLVAHLQRGKGRQRKGERYCGDE